MIMSGLEALTANYTDSEDEDRGSQDGVDPEPPAKASGPPALDRLRGDDGSDTPASGSRPPSSARSTPTMRTRLVSYGAEDIKDDEEGMLPAEKNEEAQEAGDEDNEPVDMEIDTEDDDLKDAAAKHTEPSSSDKDGAEGEEESKEDRPPNVDAWTQGMLQLPPEPSGTCDPHLQEIVDKVYQKKMERGYDMNAVIQDMKSFRNPSIYEKLIHFCNIDEHGTNFPKDLYDGHLFGPESYYDELAKAQKVDMDKREKAAKERQSRETKRQVMDDSSAPTKRRSKWDQVGPSSNVAAAAAQAASVAANLPVLRTAQMAAGTSSASTKSIPAFGMLKRQ